MVMMILQRMLQPGSHICEQIQETGERGQVRNNVNKWQETGGQRRWRALIQSGVGTSCFEWWLGRRSGGIAPGGSPGLQGKPLRP